MIYFSEKCNALFLENDFQDNYVIWKLTEVNANTDHGTDLTVLVV